MGVKIDWDERSIQIYDPWQESRTKLLNVSVVLAFVFIRPDVAKSRWNVGSSTSRVGRGPTGPNAKSEGPVSTRKTKKIAAYM